jgi:hypothetical protein
MRTQAIPDATKVKFLREDLFDSLRWLFVGAVTWAACRSQPQVCRNQDALGMFTSLNQARALYEFFYRTRAQADDARACHFASAWNPRESDLYCRYMAGGKPANKRLFHLAYNRADHAGGSGQDGPDHLKNQVLEFAKDLYTLTEEFASNADAAFRDSVQYALQEALKEAGLAAGHYGIANPF